MTNLKDSPQTSKSVDGKPNFFSQEEATPKTEETPPSHISKAVSQGSNLQRRLLLGVLPLALLPLVVAGTFGWRIIKQNVEQEYRNRLNNQTLLAGEDMEEWLSGFWPVPETLASNPIVLDAVRRGNQQAIAQGLNNRSVQALEQQFSETKLLNPDSTLNTYLQKVATSHNVAEIIITEKNGLNVAYNQPTSDFVQKGEPWWESGQSEGQAVSNLEYDDSANTNVIPMIQKIQDPETNEFLGVIKVGVPSVTLQTVQKTLEHSGILPTGEVQVLNTSNNQVLLSVTEEGRDLNASLQGGDAVQGFAAAMVEAHQGGESGKESLREIAGAYEMSQLEVLEHSHAEEVEHEGDDHDHEEEAEMLQAKFVHEGREYRLATIPETDWVAISSVDQSVLQSAGNDLIGIYAIVALVVGALAVGGTIQLSRQLSSPLVNVSQTAEKATAGDLSVRAQPQGTVETQTLANSFNGLVERVQGLLQEREKSAEQQRQQREELEEEVVRLMTDIEDAAEGDLTVRAQLMAGDIGIVADLFNAVIENLQETVQQVKTSAIRLNDSLGANEMEIRQLAEGAIAEAEQIQVTLNSVEIMNDSIQEVAQNAQKAATIADNALVTAQQGNEAMDETVQSIQGLRSTVSATSKKMKQMGESAQKISQVVSLIDEISLKTSLLAINASVEANRAGELGQGFTAVAEQVESLAEQSASAAKEIAQIVTNIQRETQEAIETMEEGTSQVVESTRTVEETKERLGEVVQRSEEIDTLMQSISNSTVSQAETSQAVSRLMEQLAQSSRARSQSSQEVAEAIQETAAVAKNLEGSVEQFKVEK